MWCCDGLGPQRENKKRLTSVGCLLSRTLLLVALVADFYLRVCPNVSLEVSSRAKAPKRGGQSMICFSSHAGYAVPALAKSNAGPSIPCKPSAKRRSQKTSFFSPVVSMADALRALRGAVPRYGDASLDVLRHPLPSIRCGGSLTTEDHHHGSIPCVVRRLQLSLWPGILSRLNLSHHNHSCDRRRPVSSGRVLQRDLDQGGVR